jgi:hypothetical protein
MKIIIYRQAKSAMQSGKLNCKKWLVKSIEEKASRSIDNIMRWVSCDNTQSQIQLEFSNKDDAIEYATKNNFEYEIVEPREVKIKPKSYAENFTN